MTDPVPSKKLLSERLRDLFEDVRCDPIDYSDLVREVEALERPAHEREMPHCSTCSCPPCQAPEPAAERCKHGNPIDPTGSYVCLKCFNEPAGFCCDINASHPGKHRDGCPAQPPGAGQ
jgi:hypothetical protein